MPRHRRHHPARKDPRPNPSGVHFLTARHIVDDLVRSCAPGPDDLVVDFGAGTGAVTAALAGTGASVLAVERDPEFAEQLRDRVRGHGNVRVGLGDARTFPLPRRRFLVVSSIPYSISTTSLRRLLGPRDTAMHRAALIVEWGFAKRLTAPVPRSRELAWWAARFDIRLVRRVPAHSFRPAPRVDSAHVLLRRGPELGPRAERALWTLLGAAYSAPRAPARNVVALTGRRPRRLLRGHAIDPDADGRQVPPARWAALAAELARDRSLHFPPLPRSLTARR